MLKNIKSSYIIKIIFIYFDSIKKLNLVRYNKSLQNILKISIIKYKIYSKKYIIYETMSKTKGKEYDCFKDTLIFEGEYLDRKRNGKGKEYKDGIIKFEGEYLNGKRNGTGKEYRSNGTLIFEGEYLNGYRHGKGKEFNYKSQLIFDGVYQDGKRWEGKRYDSKNNIIYELKDGKGYVKEYDDNDKLIFECQYSNGVKNGKLKQYFSDGSIKFQGDFVNGKIWNVEKKIRNKTYILKDGKGTLYEWCGRGCYGIYEYENGLKNGKGKEYFWYRLSFEGEYKNDLKNGKGKECFKGSITFEGEYLNGLKHGKGKEYDGHYLKFDGEYLYGYKRKGKNYVNGILEYEGEYLFGKKWEGKGYDKNGNVIYELINGNGNIREYGIRDTLIFEGEYLNGKKNGKGKEYYFYDGNLIYEGEYLNGLKHGIGKEYDSNGNLIFEGEYLNGEKINSEKKIV